MKMRVVAGIAKGQTLRAVPGTTTRPTSDKVKEAIFNRIGPYFEGGTVLDLFAGSGALGIEALSRGMDHAVFVDVEQKSVSIIHKNIQATRLDLRSEVYRSEARRALQALAKRNMRFDVVFLDPPYRMKIGNEILQKLHELCLLNVEAIIVWEHESSYTCDEEVVFFEAMPTAIYGQTAVRIYRYMNLINKGGRA